MNPVRLFASGLLLVGLAGCGSDPPKSRPAPSPAPPVVDASTRGPAVILRWNGDHDHAVLDVVARGVEEIHGSAFRIFWDPTKLAFGEAHAGEAWSKEALILAKEGAPGELVVAWTERGPGAGVRAVDETRLGSIDITLKTNEAIPIMFRAERSRLQNSKGDAIPVEWRGLTIGP